MALSHKSSQNIELIPRFISFEDVQRTSVKKSQGRIKRMYFFFPFLIQGTFWRLLMKPFFVFFSGLNVSGYEHIKRIREPVIFACNHASSLDAVLLPLALPFWSRFSPVFYVSREAGRYTGWRRLVFTFFNLEHIGSYSVRHHQQDYAQSLAKHVDILKDGGSVCIFPEGSTTKTGSINHARGGVGYLADATSTPVVPVLITGTYGLTPGKFFNRRGSISIQFFPPMYFKTLEYEHSAVVASEYKKHGETVLNILRVAKSERPVDVL